MVHLLFGILLLGALARAESAKEVSTESKDLSNPPKFGDQILKKDASLSKSGFKAKKCGLPLQLTTFHRTKFSVSNSTLNWEDGGTAHHEMKEKLFTLIDIGLPPTPTSGNPKKSSKPKDSKKSVPIKIGNSIEVSTKPVLNATLGSTASSFEEGIFKLSESTLDVSSHASNKTKYENTPSSGCLTSSTSSSETTTASALSKTSAQCSHTAANAGNTTKVFSSTPLPSISSETCSTGSRTSTAATTILKTSSVPNDSLSTLPTNCPPGSTKPITSTRIVDSSTATHALGTNSTTPGASTCKTTAHGPSAPCAPSSTHASATSATFGASSPKITLLLSSTLTTLGIPKVSANPSALSTSTAPCISKESSTSCTSSIPTTFSTATENNCASSLSTGHSSSSESTTCHHMSSTSTKQACGEPPHSSLMPLGSVGTTVDSEEAEHMKVSQKPPHLTSKCSPPSTMAPPNMEGSALTAAANLGHGVDTESTSSKSIYSIHDFSTENMGDPQDFITVAQNLKKHRGSSEAVNMRKEKLIMVPTRNCPKEIPDNDFLPTARQEVKFKDSVTLSSETPDSPSTIGTLKLPSDKQDVELLSAGRITYSDSGSFDWIDDQLAISGGVFLALLCLAGILMGSRDVRSGFVRILSPNRRAPDDSANRPLVHKGPSQKLGTAAIKISLSSDDD